MLIYFFQLFYEKDNCNLFIIHFRVKDTKYLKYYFIFNFFLINSLLKNFSISYYVNIFLQIFF